MNMSAKQQTQLANAKVPMNRIPPANFKVVHTQFVFAQLNTAFNRKAAKSYPQQPLKRHARRIDQTVRQKVFNLAGLQYVRATINV
jgi:hypothetical protein